MKTSDLRIDGARLGARLAQLGEIGALPGGGVCRLALSDEDRAGRERVSAWMRELGLSVTVDRIGNVVGLRRGREDGPPVVVGSHIDTVATGGLYDGNLGVLAGLEVVARLNEAGIETRGPVAVAFFTNEEGARFAPDMMGSGVHQGALELEAMLEAVGADGARVGDELARIGQIGTTPCGDFEAAAYLELHIEQGPVLEQRGVGIGAVTGVQGISWTELVLEGTSNHAGTTPMELRRDAGLAAAEVAVRVRRIARELGGTQVGTVGSLRLEPDLVNVIARRAVMTVDLRNTDDEHLKRAEALLQEHVAAIAEGEGIGVTPRTLARFAPVAFDPGVVDLVEGQARDLGASTLRLPSGAGHDAQMFAPNCPSGMIFVPSVRGISHNVEEHTEPADVETGANVLLRCLLELAG